MFASPWSAGCFCRVDNLAETEAGAPAPGIIATGTRTDSALAEE